MWHGNQESVDFQTRLGVLGLRNEIVQAGHHAVECLSWFLWYACL